MYFNHYERFANSPKELLGLIFVNFIEDAKNKGVSIRKYCEIKKIHLSDDLIDQLDKVDETFPFQQIKFLEILIADQANQVLLLRHSKKEVFNG